MRKKMIKNLLGVFLISLTVFSGCGEASSSEETETIQQQETNTKKKKESKWDDFLGDVKITLNDYKIGTHPEVASPILILEYNVNNTGNESIMFNERYSNEVTFKVSRFGGNQETIYLSESNTNSMHPIKTEILSGENKIVKKYYMLPNTELIYDREYNIGLYITNTITDIQTGESLHILF